jgi:glycosyltransferase involved in cell wall biosynthesis
MKVLFVGPYPPPHGGISVHVWSAHALMKRAGQQSNVLNIDPRAAESDAYIKISGALDLIRELGRHVRSGWSLNVHTNGHNPKSWAIAMVCGIAGRFGPGAELTLHSGIAPAYIRSAPKWMRRVIRHTCHMYNDVVCVSSEIAAAVAGVGLPQERIHIMPAFLPVEVTPVAIPDEIERWLAQHSPVITCTMFFRPEYGFDLLVQAVERLRKTWPRVGCLVMGSGENREQAAALVQERGLSDTIALCGDLDHELCLVLMSRSAVFVRPTFRDGDSISVREAVALGVPVVASNVGTRPEGVHLFQVGEVDELVERMIPILSEVAGRNGN